VRREDASRSIRHEAMFNSLIVNLIQYDKMYSKQIGNVLIMAISTIQSIDKSSLCCLYYNEIATASPT